MQDLPEKPPSAQPGAAGPGEGREIKRCLPEHEHSTWNLNVTIPERNTAFLRPCGAPRAAGWKPQGGPQCSEPPLGSKVLGFNSVCNNGLVQCKEGFSFALW